MKKSLTFIFVFLLSLCFASLTFVNAKTGVAEGAVDGTDYLAQEVYLKNYDFENLEVGQTYTAGFTSGIYANTSLVAVEGINGVSLKYSSSDAQADIVEVFSFDDMGNAAYRTAGTYGLSFKVKLQDAAKFVIWIVRNYDEISGGNEGLITEYRRIGNYESGVLTSVTNDDINGWRTDWTTSPVTVQPGYKNLKETITDGVLEVYFEYEVTEAMTWGSQWTPTIVFKPQLNAGGSMIIDDIQVVKVGEQFKYFTTVWDTSIEDLDLNGNPWDNQPIWANSMAWETENPLDGTHSIRVDGSATNDPVWGVQVGGFDTTTEGKKLLKTTGLHYIQMDVDSADFEWFNIWTSGDDYYAIKYTLGTGWSTEGKVQNFNAQDLGTCWRISYYVDYVNVETPHNISVYNGTGSILFDNLVVAYVDNSPYATNGTYNLIDTQDVILNVELKGQTFVELKDGEGNVVETNLYSLENNQLTLKKELFASSAESYTFKLVSTGGERSVEVKQNDNRVVISGVSATVSKVYDGTTAIDASGVTFVLDGVNEGDEVTLTADLAFADKNVGTDKSLVVTNPVLSGADSGKYILPETITLTGTITPKALSFEFDSDAFTKVYDGTVDCGLAVKNVEGKVEGDDLLITVTGNFDKAGVDASSINVTVEVEGNDKANYTYEASQVINEGISITPAKVTVIANDQTKQEETADPELTYTVNGLVEGDALTGALSRSEGETVGVYDITLGTLSAGANYEIDFTGAKLTITEKPAVVVNKAQLASAIASAEALSEDEYTTESWQALQTALTAAKEANSDEDITQEEVDNALSTLTNAVSSLQKVQADEGCKLFGYQLVMQLVLFLSVFATALYFIRRK